MAYLVRDLFGPESEAPENLHYHYEVRLNFDLFGRKAIPEVVLAKKEKEPIALFESGAILIYLAEKAGMLLGDTLSDKYKTIQWVMFQMGGVGPMFGQLGFFVKFAGAQIEDPRPRDRYIAEARRLLAVVDEELEGKDWIIGPYTIADIALAPWLNALEFYGAKDLVGWSDLKNVPAYVDRFFQRPAAERGRGIPAPA